MDLGKPLAMTGEADTPCSPNSNPSDCPWDAVRISGRQIVDILKKNPDKDPDQYDEDDIAHMRRVVAVSVIHSSTDLDGTTEASGVQQTPSRPRGDGQAGYEQQELQVVEELGP